MRLSHLFLSNLNFSVPKPFSAFGARDPMSQLITATCLASTLKSKYQLL